MKTEIHCQEFHELAMDYRGASFAHAPHAYAALCDYVEDRIALAASGGNAAPGLTDAAIAAQWKTSCIEGGDTTNALVLHFARAIEAASAPNAALVAALEALIEVAEQCDSWQSFPGNALAQARMALSAAGQEVGK